MKLFNYCNYELDKDLSSLLNENFELVTSIEESDKCLFLIKDQGKLADYVCINKAINLKKEIYFLGKSSIKLPDSVTIISSLDEILPKTNLHETLLRIISSYVWHLTKTKVHRIPKNLVNKVKEDVTIGMKLDEDTKEVILEFKPREKI